MSKETGGSRMGRFDLLEELLMKRPAAILILSFSNVPRPVSFEELHVQLGDRYAAHNIKSPSEREVRRELRFLIKNNLLTADPEKKEYQITPRGAEVTTDLFPVTERRFAKA